MQRNRHGSMLMTMSVSVHACSVCVCTEARCMQKDRHGTMAVTLSVSVRRDRKELTDATTGEQK